MTRTGVVRHRQRQSERAGDYRIGGLVPRPPDVFERAVVQVVPSLRVFEEGSPLAAFPAEPAPLPGETVVIKQYASAFHGTSLAATLTATGVDTLFICGLTTSCCVRASTTDGLQHGFRPLVVADGCGDRDERIQAANLLDLEAKYADVLSLPTAAQTTTGTAGAASNTYTYDQAGRLASWSNGTSTTAYGYDADSNRTTNGATTATFNARDQITSSGTTSYAYTARGTLSSQTTGATTTNYGYDAFDQLSTAGATAHSYDALGRDVTAGTATFTYDGTSSQPSGDGTQTFGYGPDGQLDSIGSGGGAALAFTDQHGDVVGQFTPTGTGLSGSVAFDPWGQPTASAGVQADLGYQGGWTDPGTGYVGTATRWYSPAVGGFSSHDTYPIDPNGPPAAANPYAYANGDPIGNADPTGQFAPSPIDTACTENPAACEEAAEACAPAEEICGGAAALFDGIWYGAQVFSGLSHLLGGHSSPAPKARPDPRSAPSFGESLSIAALKALHGDDIDDIDIWYPSSPGYASGGGRSGGGRSGGGRGGRSPDFRPIPMPPPPPPLGFTAPINERPTGQSDPSGDIVTRQPGTRTINSGPGDAPVNTGLAGEINPAAEPTPAFQAANTPEPAGANSPEPLPPAQAQLDAAACTGQQTRSDGTVSALICDGGAPVEISGTVNTDVTTQQPDEQSISDTFTADDVDRVVRHLDTLDHFEANDMMLNRISQAIAEGRDLTDGQVNFMRHELAEAPLMEQGMSYDEAHEEALKVHPPGRNYDPDVIDQFPVFGPWWRRLNGLPPR